MDLRLMLLSLALLFFSCFYSSDASPVKSMRQYLPPKPGYIPVYIQEGDTPPDVESIYEVLDENSPAADDKESDLSDQEQTLDDTSVRELRQSEEFIIQQLTDSIKHNEVRGIAEEMPNDSI